MRNKSTLFVVAMLLLTGLEANAQCDNVWAFGDSAGVDFNSSSFKAIKTGIIRYTSGVYVYAGDLYCSIVA